VGTSHGRGVLWEGGGAMVRQGGGGRGRVYTCEWGVSRRGELYLSCDLLVAAVDAVAFFKDGINITSSHQEDEKLLLGDVVVSILLELVAC